MARTKEEIRTAARVSMHKRRDSLRQKGFCIDCGRKPAEPERACCKKCLRDHRIAAKRHYERVRTPAKKASTPLERFMVNGSPALQSHVDLVDLIDGIEPAQPSLLAKLLARLRSLVGAR